MESLLNQVAPVVEMLGQNNNGVAAPAGGSATSTSPASAAANISPQPAAAQLSTAPAKPPPPVTDSHEDSSRNPCGIKKAVPREDADVEEDVANKFEHLTVDDHGHLRWIGSSSTMSLIQSLRDLLADRPAPPESPEMDDDGSPGPAPTGNVLYFPRGLGFGKVHALPGADEVIYPPRDLADKLVSSCPTPTSRHLNIVGRNLLPEVSLLVARAR